MFDQSTLPVSGGIIVGALLYGSISVFGTGQLVGERLIEKANWSNQCQRVLIAELADSQTGGWQGDAMAVPDCSAMTSLFGLNAPELCSAVDALSMPYRLREERLAAAKKRRLDQAMANTQSRCACAAALTLEDRKIAFGVHAGSLRVVTPMSVRNLNHELQASLQSSSCKMGS